MKKYTAIIFNKNKEIVSILRDGLSLFSKQDAVQFKELIPENSRPILSQFFTSLSKIGVTLDWAVEILHESQSQKIFFS